MMKWNQNTTAKPLAGVDCGYASINLSRLLDNDLSSADATAITAHLHGCLACRNEFEIMRAQQTIVSALPIPPGGRAARERVLRRLEAGGPIARKSNVSALRSPAVARSCTAGFVSLAALVLAGSLFFAFKRTPTAAVVSRQPPHVVASVRPLHLPARSELQVLFAIHDRKMTVTAQALTPAATPVRKLVQRRANKRAHPAPGSRTQDERFAKLAAKATGDNLALGQASHGSVTAEYLASDDVPEAL